MIIPYINLKKQYLNERRTLLPIIDKILKSGQYVGGQEIEKFEKKIASFLNVKYCAALNSGTDALLLGIHSLGIKRDDEVITTPYTFYATIGAIVTSGAIPRFVDIGLDYNIDPKKIEDEITSKTKAIVPVHWSGLICDMNAIKDIANKHNLSIVEDACHAINARREQQTAGKYGETACYSMHPLKNLNVWGDGGVITTNNEEIHDRLVLLRNHGLRNRDLCDEFAYNSRLDTLQAIVAKHYLKKINHITDMRIRNASLFDKELSAIKEITIPKRHKSIKQVFHIYVIRAKERDQLQKHLLENGIDAKIHYPVPMHLQPAAKEFGYFEKDFPIAEQVCKEVISLPVHEFISEEQVNFSISKFKEFYS